MPAKLEMPRTAAWRLVSNDSSVVETVAVLDTRWRLELTGSRGVQVVAVFDGASFACTKPKVTAEELDPIKVPQQLFSSLPPITAMNIERVQGRDYWHYAEQKDGIEVDVWVDTQTKFIRRLRTRGDGAESINDYELISLDVEHHAPKLFDKQNLEPLISK
jgi:hypothetical protein